MAVSPSHCASVIGAAEAAGQRLNRTLIWYAVAIEGNIVGKMKKTKMKIEIKAKIKMETKMKENMKKL